jgi:uncharacterized protein GlcG (DUF336 family)
MSNLSLEQATQIVDAALAEGRKRNLLPLTVVVLDAGGHAVALKREDGASLLRPQIATAKAWGTLGMGFGGRELARRAAKAPAFFGALSDMSGGRMVPVPGGVLIRAADRGVVGAVGISGDTSEKDEDCAVHGIRAAGLTPDTGD